MSNHRELHTNKNTNCYLLRLIIRPAKLTYTDGFAG